MTKNKKVVAIIFMLIIGGVLLYRQIAPEGTALQKRNKEQNPAQYKIISSSHIDVGDDIESGFYDVRALDGDAELSGIKLRQGDFLHALPLHENEKYQLKGKLEFSPASFSKLSSNNGVTKIPTSGFYYVGGELQSGKYQFLLKDSLKPVDIFINITNKQQNKMIDTVQWDQVTKEKSKVFTLKEGYFVEIVYKKDINGYEEPSATLLLIEK
ncbi:hypothetical protein [Bacillus rubiinfantis]|uniref:hypothetical protein n=1 Tax=Bacillus rubiinfantis TaxID=1499680 RepID=UPI0005A94689|nr:hypothetical protein [Bacillus rubiinfantis]